MTNCWLQLNDWFFISNLKIKNGALPAKGNVVIGLGSTRHSICNEKGNIIALKNDSDLSITISDYDHSWSDDKKWPLGMAGFWVNTSDLRASDNPRFFYGETPPHIETKYESVDYTQIKEFGIF